MNLCSGLKKIREQLKTKVVEDNSLLGQSKFAPNQGSHTGDLLGSYSLDEPNKCLEKSSYRLVKNMEPNKTALENSSYQLIKKKEGKK